MSKLIEIKNRFNGEVLFSSTNDDNTPAKNLMLAKKLGISMRNADLSNTDLSDGNFVGMDFDNATFENSIISGANFFRATFISGNISNVTGIGANFQEATLHKTYARGGNFTKAWFTDALSMEGDFRNCKFDGANIKNFMTRGTLFRGCTGIDAIVDETDTRILYRWEKIDVPVVCEGECQHCVGCEAHK